VRRAALAVAALLVGGAAAPVDVEIEVMGAGRIRIDYRVRGKMLRSCGPRDRRQDSDAVRLVCGHVAACVAGGAKGRDAVALCVESRMAVERIGE
jgi:hypothetical protein